MTRHPEYDAALHRLQARLPQFAGRTLQYLTDSSPWVRVPPALALTAGGLFGLLPILGFWMVPLGLVLLAQDVPVLRPPLARALNWLDSRLPTNGPAATAEPAQ